MTVYDGSVRIIDANIINCALRGQNPNTYIPGSWVLWLGCTELTEVPGRYSYKKVVPVHRASWLERSELREIPGMNVEQNSQKFFVG